MKPHALLLLALCIDGAQDSRASRLAEPASKPLLVFPQAKADLAVWMREQGLESRRHDPKRFAVGDGALHLVSEKDSVMLGTEKGFPIAIERWPRLRMRVRIDRVPKGTDLAKTSGDDAAFRLYVAFDRGGGLLSPPHTIAYTWAERGEAGVVTPSAHFTSLRYLTIGVGVTASETGPQWVTIERDLAADYANAFPKDQGRVPALRGIVLKCDSNDTGTGADAWVSCVELLAPEPKSAR